MHSLMVKKDFVASHALIGGDWGRENQPHPHDYVLELVLEGPHLNRHNYLVDIVEVSAFLDELVGRYQDRFLNDAPGFEGQNPSLELFAQLLCTAVATQLPAAGLTKIKVILWENDFAWAGYEMAGR